MARGGKQNRRSSMKYSGSQNRRGSMKHSGSRRGSFKSRDRQKNFSRHNASMKYDKAIEEKQKKFKVCITYLIFLTKYL